MKKKAVIYIHGKGGNTKEAERYEKLFPTYEVVGFDYVSQTPWEAKQQFTNFFDNIGASFSSIILVANSIGAYFAMNAVIETKIEKAYFISPIVGLTIMENGEHWFHTEEQMKFLEDWVIG